MTASYLSVRTDVEDNRVVSTPNPIIQRRRLRTELRRLRLNADLTQEQVAQGMDWSLSKLIRIEGARVAITQNDLRALLRLYGVKDKARIDELLELARDARKPMWWRQFQDALTPQEASYFDYEASATFIREFQPMLVPTLLRTEEYARALYTHSLQLLSDQVDQRIRIQFERQQLFERANPPELWAILDEAVLHRPIGGADTMRGQLLHLLDVMRQANIHLQILPFAVGATPALLGGFVFLELDDADELVLTETFDSLSITDYPERTARYLETFRQLERLALGPTDSASMLERMMEGLPESDAYEQSAPLVLNNNLELHFVL